MKYEAEAWNERNINDMTQVDDYKSPGENKDASTINYLVYYKLNEHEVEISDSSEQVEVSKEPITDTHVHNTSIGTTSFDPDAIGVGIIRQVK